VPARRDGGGEVDYELPRNLEVLAAMGSEPFTIEVPAEALDDLRARLARTRWPKPLPYPGWAAGADVGYLKELVAYWAAGLTGACLSSG
jgi:Epoxide hydrolase N terminus